MRINLDLVGWLLSSFHFFRWWLVSLETVCLWPTIFAGLLCFMAKPSAFVIMFGLCSVKNIHGGHGWHRILKYDYALHVQILFIVQSLKCISWMSRRFSQYLASVRALQWIIFQTNQSYERWPSAAHSVTPDLGNSWSKQESSKTW